VFDEAVNCGNHGTQLAVSPLVTTAGLGFFTTPPPDSAPVASLEDDDYDFLEDGAEQNPDRSGLSLLNDLYCCSLFLMMGGHFLRLVLAAKDLTLDSFRTGF